MTINKNSAVPFETYAAMQRLAVQRGKALKQVAAYARLQRQNATGWREYAEINLATYVYIDWYRAQKIDQYRIALRNVVRYARRLRLRIACAPDSLKRLEEEFKRAK